MKTWIVIPARYNSTRFPGKPLALVAGKPLLQRVIERAKQVEHVAGILVATDDEKIFALAEKCGVNAAMTDSNIPTGTDRIEVAVRALDADLVVNLQGDEPLFNPKSITRAIQFFYADLSLNMATMAHIISADDFESPHCVKVVLNHRDEAIYFSRFQIPYSREKFVESSTLVYKHIGIYLFRKKFLTQFCQAPQCSLERAESLEQLRALYLGERIKVLLVEDTSIGVDVPDDVAKVESFIL